MMKTGILALAHTSTHANRKRQDTTEGHNLVVSGGLAGTKKAAPKGGQVINIIGCGCMQ